MDTAVEIQNLNKSYVKIPVLRDLSFSIRKGDIFGLLAPKGVGKTTSLNIIEDIGSKKGE